MGGRMNVGKPFGLSVEEGQRMTSEMKLLDRRAREEVEANRNRPRYDLSSSIITVDDPRFSMVVPVSLSAPVRYKKILCTCVGYLLSLCHLFGPNPIAPGNVSKDFTLKILNGVPKQASTVGRSSSQIILTNSSCSLLKLKNLKRYTHTHREREIHTHTHTHREIHTLKYSCCCHQCKT